MASAALRFCSTDVRYGADGHAVSRLRSRARAFVRVRLEEAEAAMIKYLCIGMTALGCVAITIAADAADLSMVPIYKTRPSMAATLNGSTKDQSRPADVPDRERFKLSPGTDAVTPAGAPLSGHVFWTGVYDRF